MVVRSICVLTILAASVVAQSEDPRPPLTVPEQSDWQRTSTSAEVAAFLTRLKELPHADRLTISTFGKSHEGRDMQIVRAADAGAGEAPELLRVLVVANIHAGEIEGKEASQMLLREIAHGEHEDLLKHAVLHFVPVYNVDGNDRIDPTNRRRQNGPVSGVGRRPNAQGLDLNRDFIKAESPECRALLGVVRSVDPHLVMDLHTTNGSPHAYHLTYAPSLSPNVDPRIDRLARQLLLPEARQHVADDHGFRIFDYGNFSRRGEMSWRTYDHRPRFGINYVGLRNRLSVLSEAYAYYDFHTRARVTRAFVLEVLRAAVRHREEIAAACRAADRALAEADAPIYFGFDTELGPPEQLDVLRGENRREGDRVVATGKSEPVSMPVQRAFRARQWLRLPAAWAIAAPEDAVIATLQAHGVALRRLESAETMRVERFAVDEATTARRSFQGHREVKLRGQWQDAEVELPAGSLIVSSRQPLGRLAAQLLEPQSEDSLTTWNFFDAGLAGHHPVVRVILPR